jgi:hypothetical protein
MSIGKSPFEMLSRRTMNLGSLRISLLGGALGAATILAVATGCSRDNVAQAATTQEPAAQTQAVAASQGQTPDQVQDDAQAYTIDTATVGECKAGAECTATITITAKGDYHVNDTYPFKFTAANAGGVELHGSGGNVFTGGDFARQGKTVGVMTVKFKPAAKGNVSITGTYKICICTDKICQPTSTPVTINVNVK